MSDSLPENDHWNSKKHDQNVDSCLGSESVDVAIFSYPRDDTVQKAKGDDILSGVSGVATAGISEQTHLQTIDKF
jgi:hypothetical protein